MVCQRVVGKRPITVRRSGALRYALLPWGQLPICRCLVYAAGKLEAYATTAAFPGGTQSGAGSSEPPGLLAFMDCSWDNRTHPRYVA
jgi:hypothetical protein